MSGERPIAGGEAEFEGYGGHNPADDTLNEIDATLAEAGAADEDRASTQADFQRRPSIRDTLGKIDDTLADADTYTEENQ